MRPPLVDTRHQTEEAPTRRNDEASDLPVCNKDAFDLLLIRIHDASRLGIAGCHGQG